MCSFLIIISVFLLSVLVSGSREDVRPFFSVFFFFICFHCRGLDAKTSILPIHDTSLLLLSSLAL